MQKILKMKSGLSKKTKAAPVENSEVEKELQKLISKKKAESDALRKILDAIEKTTDNKLPKKK